MSSSHFGPGSSDPAADIDELVHLDSPPGRQRFRTVLDILRLSGGGVKYVHEDQRVTDAMKAMIDHGVGSLVVKDENGKLVGFLTQRDLLRVVVQRGQPPAEYDPYSEPRAWNDQVKTMMTPSKELVFLTPNDTLRDARALMSVSGKRHIPVLSGNSLLGVISPKDIARALHQERGSDVSAKESYVSTVTPPAKASNPPHAPCRRRSLPSPLPAVAAPCRRRSLPSPLCSLPPHALCSD